MHSRGSVPSRNMKAFCAVLITFLATIALTISAEEPKSHEEEKRMLYWKRDGLEDLDDEGLLCDFKGI